jgi:hypothetical protein
VAGEKIVGVEFLVTGRAFIRSGVKAMRSREMSAL